MPKWIPADVRVVTAVNYRFGRFAMYLIYVMMAILLWSSVSRTFFEPSLITLEPVQFTMIAYYLLGGFFLFASRYALDVPVLFNQYCLDNILRVESEPKAAVAQINKDVMTKLVNLTVTRLGYVTPLRANRGPQHPTTQLNRV